MLNLDTRYKWVNNFTPGSISPGEGALYLYPLNMKVRGARRLSRRVCRSEIPLSFLLFYFLAQQPYLGPGRLFVKVPRSHSWDTSQSEELWTSDRPDAETSIWQHTTLAGGGIWTLNPSKWLAADPSLRTRGIEGKLPLPDADRTMMSGRPVLSVVTILTELIKLARHDE